MFSIYLPFELIVYIFTYFEVIDLLNLRCISTEANYYASHDILWNRFLSNLPNVAEKARRKSWSICYEAMFHIKMCERIAKEFKIPGISLIRNIKQHDPVYIFNKIAKRRQNDVIMVQVLPMYWIERFHKENGRYWNYYTLDKRTFVRCKHIQDLQHIIELLNDGFVYAKMESKYVFDDMFTKLPSKLYYMEYFTIVGEKNIFHPDYHQTVHYY